MKDKIIFSIFSSVVLVLLLVSPTAFATHSHREYKYMIGTEFLHSPVIAKAANGDTVEVVGDGMLNVDEDTVTGGGTFVHKDKDGNEIGRGNWTATSLLFFRSYGNGTLQGLPGEFEGGRAFIRVHLVAETGEEFDGVMQVECVLGKVPRGAEEGIRLNVKLGPGKYFNFFEKVHGDTLFVKQ